MNPFTANAALRVLGLPRLCMAQFADLEERPDEQAFLSVLLDLAFQARVREAKYAQALQVAHEVGHEWSGDDESHWRQPLPEVELAGADLIRQAAIAEIRHARSPLASVRWLAATIDGIAARMACSDPTIAREQQGGSGCFTLGSSDRRARA